MWAGTEGAMAALTNSRKKAFWEGVLIDQTVWGDVVSPPTAWEAVEQAPFQGATRVGTAPVGVVASRPESEPPSPAQRP